MHKRDLHFFLKNIQFYKKKFYFYNGKLFKKFKTGILCLGEILRDYYS